MNSLLIAPEIFASEGGIPRILRLYLKGLCELAEKQDNVRFIALNDSVIDTMELRPFSGPRLIEWEVCSHRKTHFTRSTLRMALQSDRIVCGHVAQLPVAWAAARLRPGLRYYLVAHGIEVWRPFSFLERRALKGARAIWCVSDFTRKQLLRHCRLPAERLVILPNALEPRLAPSEPPPPAVGPPVILAISRLTIADSYKGIEHLIAAMPLIREKLPDARLRVVGRGDGLPGLVALARRHGVAGAVEFPGYLADSKLPEEFARCRLFALPSQKEGFGLVYLEAMAHGRPCLAARAGGAPEVITPQSGILVDYGDVPGIAEATVAALRKDWPAQALLERASAFSYLRFRERLASLLSP